MLEYTFLIPIKRDSNKAEHDPACWDGLEASLCHAYGGFTRAADVFGFWWSDKQQRMIVDTSRKYVVAIPESGRSEFRKLMIAFRIEFDQQCLYVAETSQNAELI